MRDATIDDFSTHIQKSNKGMASGSANKEARQMVDPKWGDLTERLTIVDAKKVISAMSSWAQASFGVSLNHQLLARSTSAENLAGEMHDVLEAINTVSDFVA